MRLLRLANNAQCPGHIPLQYEQKSTGRVVEVLSLLQNTPRGVLRAALTGYFDYDISNCHFAIFSQLAKRYGKETPVVDYYLSNKAEVRSQLTESCSTDTRNVKWALLALL